MSTHSGELDGHPAAPTVVFIAGYGRMGSTLLDRLLGQHPQVFSGGELRHFWDRGIRDDQLCECGRPVTDCELWSRVIDRQFGDLKQLRAQQPWQLWESVDRLRTLPHIFRRRHVSYLPVQEYVDLLLGTIQSIAQVTGAKVIVDSSKYPIHGMFLNLIPEIDLRVIHLVRDPRGVAFSWQRTKGRPEVHWKTQYIRKRSILESSLAWTASSLLIEGNRRTTVPQITVRYEDLIRRPAATLDLLWRFAGVAPITGVTVGAEARIDPGHTIAGNPSRFQFGNVPIRADEEWRTSWTTPQRLAVSLLTYPIARSYGYRMFGSR